MNQAHRFKLIGKYRTPRFKYGDVVTCAILGEVRIVGLTNGRIAWPKCRSGRSRAMILSQTDAGDSRRQAKGGPSEEGVQEAVARRTSARSPMDVHGRALTGDHERQGRRRANWPNSTGRKCSPFHSGHTPIREEKTTLGTVQVVASERPPSGHHAGLEACRQTRLHAEHGPQSPQKAWHQGILLSVVTKCEHASVTRLVWVPVAAERGGRRTTHEAPRCRHLAGSAPRIANANGDASETSP